MIEIAGGGHEHAVEVGAQRDVPSTLPVLPLRETVPLPDTLTPLAIGQERSIQLVNDVLSGNRMLVMLASRSPEVESPGPEPDGRRGHLTAAEAGEHGSRARVARLVLTHISDELDEQRARAQAEQAFGGTVTVAREGAVYTV